VTGATAGKLVTMTTDAPSGRGPRGLRRWYADFDQLGRRERLQRVMPLPPLPLLAIATLLAWSAERSGFGTPERFRHGLFVVGAAAVWSLLVTMRSPRFGQTGKAVALAGHVALTAVLVGVNPWFAVFAFMGYPMSGALDSVWLSRLGVIATGMTSAAGQASGWPIGSGPPIWLYLLIAALNCTIALSVVAITGRVERQNEERGRIIEQLNETNEQLSTALAENAGLHAQLLEQAREAGIQDERQRLAGEIHDTLAQGLAGIVTQLEAAEQGKHLPEVWQRHVDQARDLARSSLTQARRSVRALRPEQLERAELPEALEELARTWSESSGVRARFEAAGTPRRLPEATAMALFRVAQEALANVARHAHATKVALTLTFLGDVVLLDVRDDGVGWSGNARIGGFGLAGMRERMARIGGTLEVETAPGDGTALSASAELA
jgi:signal transduction histidine kinase